MALEDIIKSANNCMWNGVEKTIDIYNRAYEKYPKTTQFISAAVGTVGGDAIAKKFSEGQNIELRDIAFTATASAVQAWLYPKLIPLSKKIVDQPKVEESFKKVGINKYWANAVMLTALFFPLNMAYWNTLSVKNKAAISIATNVEGAKAIGEASVPYLAVDYIVANKLPSKYALPVWSGAELGWNSFIAVKNYISKRYSDKK